MNFFWILLAVVATSVVHIPFVADRSGLIAPLEESENTIYNSLFSETKSSVEIECFKILKEYTWPVFKGDFTEIDNQLKTGIHLENDMFVGVLKVPSTVFELFAIQMHNDYAEGPHQIPNSFLYSSTFQFYNFLKLFIEYQGYLEMSHISPNDYDLSAKIYQKFMLNTNLPGCYKGPFISDSVYETLVKAEMNAIQNNKILLYRSTKIIKTIVDGKEKVALDPLIMSKKGEDICELIRSSVLNPRNNALAIIYSYSYTLFAGYFYRNGDLTNLACTHGYLRQDSYIAYYLEFTPLEAEKHFILPNTPIEDGLYKAGSTFHPYFLFDKSVPDRLLGGRFKTTVAPISEVKEYIRMHFDSKKIIYASKDLLNKDKSVSKLDLVMAKDLLNEECLNGQ
ncbi:hypothetical protein ROZALSC1DRAFT_27122 [Rozella allomycis CSF55]|uniref:Uncharacterized protein n=1 Tax=Rozella allomycis (strain CSF55) TaxID=988480 RepID=A0A075B3X8_ROZAC|nr:hypothetical protein O9G_003575 [Rozella allomycis CSF55]RKP21480.1 hypothetical protein ROZALSC1DRAFT_27122 [Rozella allomycis CSF55]|eukprot:EPZ35857.1 hypothetical protein O9G_003575 [Rozella allomycis CSF55]